MVEMKKVWSRPLTVVQNFEPNEYCASSCGEENKVYKFKCDAVSGSIIGSGGSVYLETNGEEGFQLSDTRRSLYHPCGEEHEAKVTDEFKRGYLVTLTGGVVDVIVWTGLNDDNTHCTTELNMDKWVTAKS